MVTNNVDFKYEQPEQQQFQLKQQQQQAQYLQLEQQQLIKRDQALNVEWVERVDEQVWQHILDFQYEQLQHPEIDSEHCIGSSTSPVAGPNGYQGYWQPHYYSDDTLAESSNVATCTFVETNLDGSIKSTTVYYGDACPNTGGLSDWAIFGIVVGALAGLWLLVALWKCCCRKKKKKREGEEESRSQRRRRRKRKNQAAGGQPSPSAAAPLTSRPSRRNNRQTDQQPTAKPFAPTPPAPEVLLTLPLPNESVADARARAADFVKQYPARAFHWTPNNIEQLVDKAQVAHLAVPDALHDTVWVATCNGGELVRVVFYPKTTLAEPESSSSAAPALPPAPTGPPPAFGAKVPLFESDLGTLEPASSSSAAATTTTAPDRNMEVTVLTALSLPWLRPTLPPGVPTPHPTTRAVIYFEVAITKLDPSTTLAIGLANFPAPSYQLPGRHPWSLALHSNTGQVFVNSNPRGTSSGKPLHEGDIVGLGIDTRTSAVFFTRNGVKLPDITDANVTAPYVPVHPAFGADGPCEIEVRWHGHEFQWSDANAHNYEYRLEEGVEVDPPPAPMVPMASDAELPPYTPV
ncbi:Rsp5p-dependent ubiquitination, sorting of cargo proteins at the multivesicular body [Allomyces javanicus]|nr:Rsp5p-dependent ubiquitination, sorting of cargo proteins at the multivesicular body [Allomyces javanicus]